ncbi:MAG: M15 family metallopeptidase, partial [Chloroflexota bacterium]|nr:M15 family metallopeptidase [Chloroflexota bacterium]
PTDTPVPTPTQETAQFYGTVSILDARTRARMRYSWRPGCPVPLAALRLLIVSHWGFDGRVHTGELVVHRDQAEAVLGVMRRLFSAGFPIERMLLVDVYGGSDDRSMAANNTSAFNCREVTGRPGVWSEHSYGRAIDINPVQNPYVADGVVLPPAGDAYVDRSIDARGMIYPNGPVVSAFAAIGWRWGGYWSSPTDYQHFSASGR